MISRAMISLGTIWPPLADSYPDEFGPIQPGVYQVAGELWPQAEKLVLATLGDGPEGLRLMLKAVAIVSRRQTEQPEQIQHLKAYLWYVFKNLVLTGLKKEHDHRQLEQEQALDVPPDDPVAALDRQILLQQICCLMDTWTREVFELLALGYQYEDLVPNYGKSASIIRAQYSKQLKKLRQQLGL